MRRARSNRLVAVALTAVLTVSSVGLALGRETERAYDAPELLLTQGQDVYDLRESIRYDTNKYELTVYDEGGFDINVPGSYTVEYMLTPANPSTPAPEATSTPAPEATPTPAPEATSTPAPEATPAPAPEASPTAAPETTPTPAPEASPTPAPEATPAPVPETPPAPAPEATPAPAPEASPAPEVTLPQDSADEPTVSIPDAPVPKSGLPMQLEENLTSGTYTTEAAYAPETIFFTRTVVVRAAVQYQNIRFDINTDAGLMDGMVYDEGQYSVSILDDGGFDVGKIGEYRAAYQVTNIQTGLFVAEIARYLWVTAPGVTFDAPELSLALNQQSYDLLQGITYDATRYDLGLLDPDAFDITAAETQRVMFRLTETADAQHTQEPVKAVFGRDVHVGVGPVVVIDAPALVYTVGTADRHDLLEGVTAKDETGAPVAPQVEDRTELDRASAWRSAQDTGLPVPDAAPGDAEGLPERTQLPPDLLPGEYTVTLAAKHPVTGAVFTAQRSVVVLAGDSVGQRTLTSGIYNINVETEKNALVIQGNVVLRLSGRGTIDANNATAPNTRVSNAISVAPGAALVLILEPDADVTLIGRDAGNFDVPGQEAASTAAAGAGINVEPDMGQFTSPRLLGGRLYVLGSGKLTARGGAAAKGGAIMASTNGGSGGGGAGAGIGGMGGTGGSGGGVYGNASSGVAGRTAGEIYFYTAPGRVAAYGGSGGNVGGTSTTTAFGAGGSGFPGAGIGSGGAGGGGGGRGGGGGFSGGSAPGTSGGGGTIVTPGVPGQNGNDAPGKGGKGWYGNSYGGGGTGGAGGPSTAFKGIALMENGGAAGAVTAEYGSVGTIQGKLSGYDAVNDPGFLFYGMGIGIGGPESSAAMAAKAEVDALPDLGGDLADNTYYTGRNPPPLGALTASRGGPLNTEITLKWLPPLGMDGDTAYALPAGYSYTEYVISYYDAAPTVTKPLGKPSAVVRVPADEISAGPGGLCSYTEYMPRQLYAVVCLEAANASGDVLRSLPAGTTINAPAIPSVKESAAREISVSGQYHIDVSTAAGKAPLNITAPKATLYLSGHGAFNRDTESGSGIRIAPNSQVTLVLADGAVVTALGRAAGVDKPGTAAIAVPAGASLHVVGSGVLYALGGDAKAGANAAAAPGAGGGGAGAGIGGSGGEAAGSVYLYTGTVSSYGGLGGLGGNGTDGTAGYSGEDGQPGSAAQANVLGGGGGGFPGAGIGGGGASGGGASGTDGAGGFSGGGGGTSGAGGQGFLSGSEGAGAFSPFGGVALMFNGADPAKPTAAYGSASVIGRRTYWADFTGIDRSSPFRGVGIGLGRPDGAEAAGLNTAAVVTQNVDIVHSRLEENSYNTSRSPAMPVEVEAALTPWSQDEAKALHVSWQAPQEGIDGYALPDGAAVTGYIISYYTAEPDGTAAPTETLVSIGNLTPDPVTGRYSFDLGGAAADAEWVCVRTVTGQDAVTLKSVETVERVSRIRVNSPDGSFSYYPGLDRALDGIAAQNPQGEYTLSLLGDYTLTDSDLTALGKTIPGVTKLTLDGQCMDDSLTPQGVKTFALAAAGDLLLPESGPEYVIRRVTLKSDAARLLAACGSKLTVGPGVAAEGGWSLAGGGADSKPRATDLTVNSGSWARILGGNTGGNGEAIAKLTVGGTSSAGLLSNFDLLNVSENAKLTVTGRMSHDSGGAGYGGVIQIGAGASLALPRPTGGDAATQLNRAVRVSAAGANAALILARTGSDYPNLYLLGEVPDTQAGKLTLRCADGETAASGDQLLQFAQPANAVVYPDGGKVDGSYARDFLSGVYGHGDGRIDLYADPTTGLVSFLGQNFELTAPGSTSVSTYHTLKEVYDALLKSAESGLAPGNYIITMLADYSFTQADQAALSALTGLNPNATLTLTGLNPGGANRTLDAGSRDILFPAAENAGQSAAFVFEHLKLVGTGGRTLAAMGSKLTIGPGVETPAGGWSLCGGTTGDTAITAHTDVTVRSGTFSSVYGGSMGLGTMTGGSKVTVAGGTVTDRLIGGSRGSQVGGSAVTIGTAAVVDGEVYGAGQAHSGDSVVTIAGGTVNGTVYASYFRQNGTATVNINGGTVNAGIQRAHSTIDPAALPAVILNVNADQSLTYLNGFDALTLSDGVRLTLGPGGTAASPSMDALWGNGSAGGAVTLGANSVLTLTGTGNQAGSLATTGDNARLVFSSTGTEPALIVSAGSNPVNTHTHPLTLALADGTPSSGDKLLEFTGVPMSADTADYVNGFTGNLALLADKTTGSVYLGVAVSVTDGTGGVTRYGSLAQAMAAIGDSAGEYTVAIHMEGYHVTAADGLALMDNGGNAEITYTSRVRITGEYPQAPGDVPGAEATRTVILGSADSGAPKADISLNGTTIIKEMRLQYLQADCALYANGHPLTVGPAVDILSAGDHYPVFYGGSETGTVASTSMTLLSGNYGGVYGGGRQASARVTGDSRVTMGGDAVLTGPVYGGGKAGDVGGTATVTITGGLALAPAGDKNTIVGGGETGDTGAVHIISAGGKANGTIEVAGLDRGKTTGDVTIEIRETDPGIDEQTAVLANIYGATLAGAGASDAVGGKIDIHILNGRNYGAIRGGAGEAAGGASITLGSAALTMQDITDFDTLNLGIPADPGVSVPASRITLILTGRLQGGDLNFWSGSVLTLQGTSEVPGDLTVRNLHTDATFNRSHLHVYKAPTAGGDIATRPLHVTGENTSDPDCKLVLGVYGVDSLTALQSGADGDDLLVFDLADNAKSGQYVSDVQGLDIVENKDAHNTIELGLAGSPQLALIGVRHTDAGGTTQADRPDRAAVKTLTFDIASFTDLDPSAVGNPIESAYIDTSWKADETWAGDGTLPAGVTEITVTHPDESSVHWTGTATMPISPPAGTAPEYYFAHVRDDTGRTRTIVLDVHSALKTASAKVEKNSAGDYTFTVTLQDPKPEKPDEVDPDIIYTASGLHQLAWAVGPAHDTDPAGQAAALGENMADDTSGALHGVTTLDVPAVDPHEWTFTVPSGVLGENPDRQVVYVYAKDAMGNTGVYPIPLDINLIDVEVPMAAGVVALRGTGDGAKLLAPNCYLVNWSAQPVKAELVGAEIPAAQGGSGDGKLVFTAKGDGFADNEMNLQVVSVDDGLGNNFHSESVLNLGDAPVNLGVMPAVTEPDHGASFTFYGLYDAGHIIKTSGWSQCVLSYRFTIVPPAPSARESTPEGGVANG